MKIIKSIEHLSLRNCNRGKLEKLEAVAGAYHSYLQKVVDYYWENNLLPSKYVANLNFSTSLSKRYQQTCGSQAIAVIKSYWSKIKDKVKNRISSEIKTGGKKKRKKCFTISPTNINFGLKLKTKLLNSRKRKFPLQFL